MRDLFGIILGFILMVCIIPFIIIGMIMDFGEFVADFFIRLVKNIREEYKNGN